MKSRSRPSSAPSLGGSPATTRRPAGASRSNTDAQARLQQAAPASPAEAEARGWWEKATDWASDQVGAAAEAVGETWDAASDAARRTWQLVSDTDVDWDDDRVELSTDLDAVLPVLPESLREAVTLGGQDPAANRVSATLDRKTGAVRLDVPDLELAGTSIGGFAVESLVLAGLSIEVRDAGALAGEAAEGTAAAEVLGWLQGDDKAKAGNGATLRVASVRATGVVGPGGEKAALIEIRDLVVDARSKEGGLLPGAGGPEGVQASFSVGSVNVVAGEAGDAAVGQLALAGLSADLDAERGEARASLDALDARDVRAAGASLGDASLRDLSADLRSRTGGVPASLDDVRGSASLGAAAAHGLVAGRTSLDSAEVDRARVSRDASGTAFSAGAAGLDGLEAHGFALDRARAEGVSGKVGARSTRARVRRASARGIEGDTVGVEDLRASGLLFDVQNDFGYVGAFAGEASAKGMRIDDSTIGEARIVGLDTGTARHDSGNVSRGSLRSAEARDVSVQGNHADALEAKGLSWNARPKRFQLDAEQLGVEGADIESLGIEKGEARGFRYLNDRAGNRLGIDAVSARGVRAGDEKAGVTAGAARVSRLDARETDESLRVGIGEARAERVRAHAPAGQLAAGAAGLKNLDVRKTGEDLRVHLDEAAAENLSGDYREPARKAKARPASAAAPSKAGVPSQGTGGRAAPGRTSPKLDIPKLAGLVDDADLRAHIPLRAGEIGPATVAEGTALRAEARVRGGEVDPAGTRVRASKELDGPAWVGVRGAYLENGEKGGLKVRADLSGMVDLDVTDSLPGGRDELPRKLSDLAALASPADKASGAAKAKATGGGAKAAAPGKAAAAAKKPAKPSPVDLAGATVDARVGLAGGFAAGGVSGVLDRERATDNRVDVHAEGSGRLVVDFVRMLVRSLKFDTSGARGSAGKVSAGGAHVEIDRSGGATAATGSVGSVRVQDLDLRR